MPDEITPQETAIIAKLTALTGSDTKKLFDVVEGYTGALQGKTDEELKEEITRRGMSAAFVFNNGGTFSRKPGMRAKRRKLVLDFVVLIAATNFSGGASARTGSPGSAGAYALLCSVADALDGKSLAPGLPPLFGQDIVPMVIIPSVSIYAMIFVEKEDGPTQPS